MHTYSQISVYLCIIYETITMKLFLTESLKILLWYLFFLVIIMVKKKDVHKAFPTKSEHKYDQVVAGLNCNC